MDPYDHDVIRFLKEREIRLVHADLMPPPPPPSTPLDQWGEKLEGAAQHIREISDAIRQTPAPPVPRFGQLFDVREASGHTVCGVYLAAREWAVLFVELVAEIKQLLSHVPRHLLLRYLPGANLEYVALLCSAAAWSAHWEMHPAIQEDWRDLRVRLAELRRTRDTWGILGESTVQHEVQAMTKKRMLRSGTIDGKWFYSIEAGALDAKRWEAWFACGSLNQKSGSGAMSETLKVADTIQELQIWADALTTAQIDQLIRKHCGGGAA